MKGLVLSLAVALAALPMALAYTVPQYGPVYDGPLEQTVDSALAKGCQVLTVKVGPPPAWDVDENCLSIPEDESPESAEEDVAGDDA